MKLTYNTKLVGCLLVVTILTIGFCLGVGKYLRDVANNMLQETNEMKIAIETDNWEVVEDIYFEAYEEWQEERSIWQCLLHHDEIANIDSAFLMLQGSIEDEEKGNIMGQLYVLEYYIEVPADSEVLNWCNLF